MPAADQASLALAIEQLEFQPFVLPHNWNLHPIWNRFFFGPIKIWHGNYEAPKSLLSWNKQQSDENAVIQSVRMDPEWASEKPDKQELAASAGN